MAYVELCRGGLQGKNTISKSGYGHGPKAFRTYIHS